MWQANTLNPWWFQWLIFFNGLTRWSNDPWIKMEKKIQSVTALSVSIVVFIYIYRDFYLPKFQDIVRLKFWKSWTFPTSRTISVYIEVNFICILCTRGQNVLLQSSASKDPVYIYKKYTSKCQIYLTVFYVWYKMTEHHTLYKIMLPINAL